MEPFLGQIQTFGFSFPPLGWAHCEGQLLAISQNDALFSLLGTIYGGDGRTTFGLPDLRGRVMVHKGTGPGLSNRSIGQKSGQESYVIATTQMPSHNHGVGIPVNGGEATTSNPDNAVLAQSGFGSYASQAGSNEFGIPFNTANTGGSIDVNNMQPFLAMHTSIALVGIYPSRS